MKYILCLILVLTFGVSIGQVYNPTPQYVFKNRLGVGRSTPVDSAAYMNVGPNGGAVAGIVLPRIADTLTISGTKRHGLLIFSNQLNKFAWYDSTNTRWVEVGSGSSSSGEVMLMNGSRTIGDSLLFPSVSGDTAYLRNILAGSGLLFENMGDTVLKINVDSSTIANIYNSDGTITGTRIVDLNDNDFLIYNVSGTGTGLSLGLAGGSIFLDSSSVSRGYLSTSFSAGSQVESIINAGAIQLLLRDDYDNTNNSGVNIQLGQGHLQLSNIPYYGISDTSMYWNPSTGQVQRATNKNIYNSDGTITDAERYVKLAEDGYFTIRNFDDDFSFFSIDNTTANGASLGIASINNNTGLSSSIGLNSAFTDSTGQAVMSTSAVKGGQTYAINIVLDSSGINFGGSLNYGLNDKPSSANAVQFADNSIYILSDLTSAAASRTFRTIPKSNGAYLKIINQSSDATYKWTFAGITVYDKNGSTVTAIDDHTVYELIYIAAGQSEFGAGWHIINKY